MRNLGLALIALTIAASAAPTQTKDWANKMFPEGVAHDFGGVPRGAQLFHKFKMTNIWAVPVEIIQARVSCGCVTATAKPVTLNPHETGYLEVTMDARRFTGPKTVTIFVTLGPQYVSTATLQVSANSRPDVVFNPGQVNFGVVAAGQSQTQNIDVEYAGVLDWQVSEVIKNDAPLDVTFERIAYATKTPGQVGYHVRVSLKPDAPAGMNRWEINLKTNDPASPHVPILVEATVQAALTVIPNPLNVQALKVGEMTTQRIVVRGSKPFKILSVEGTDADVNVDVPGVAAQNHVVTVKCRPSQAGDFRRQLLIKTDLGVETVQVVGTAVP